jgi:hypothetical protein
MLIQRNLSGNGLATEPSVTRAISLLGRLDPKDEGSTILRNVGKDYHSKWRNIPKVLSP